ncbi:MAG: ribosomal-processing cysteine protease Prp [Firmicutes bacterium]|jgi:uncharacterized protein YsxB (DUF464 family)|nr:ribosomal-processing cysteine protease Prp [Bacillota bacterium]HOB22115.1 ribosomal-processing cysteine protease Prp [Bacillota bacterium]HQD39965.1 ribosomal-processing cysteine protease Prp [Bacillota bacterium]
MIKVLIRKQGQLITEIRAQGHSGYAEAGSDIVCAGVSALLQALKIGLEELAGEEIGKIEDGFLACPVSSDPKAQFLAKVMELSLREMAQSYSDYLQVEGGESDVQPTAFCPEKGSRQFKKRPR